jgi:hypothetical protein
VIGWFGVFVTIRNSENNFSKAENLREREVIYHLYFITKSWNVRRKAGATSGPLALQAYIVSSVDPIKPKRNPNRNHIIWTRPGTGTGRITKPNRVRKEVK